MSNTPNPQNRQLPIRQLCARYCISPQTVDRWQEQGLLPQPMRVRRYRYWSELELDRMDAQRERAGVTQAKSSKEDHAA